MKRTIRGAVVAVAAAALLLAGVGSAQASVGFDPATGTGFVGKGDIQTVFGWNNQTAQANATAVTFTYLRSDTYVAECQWTGSNGTFGQMTYRFPRIASTLLNAAVSSDPWLKNQYTGYNLTGFGATTTYGEVPAVGGACTGFSGEAGTWSSVSLFRTWSGLYATYGYYSSVLEWIDPPF